MPTGVGALKASVLPRKSVYGRGIITCTVVRDGRDARRVNLGAVQEEEATQTADIMGFEVRVWVGKIRDGL